MEKNGFELKYEKRALQVHSVKNCALNIRRYGFFVCCWLGARLLFFFNFFLFLLFLLFVALTDIKKIPIHLHSVANETLILFLMSEIYTLLFENNKFLVIRYCSIIVGI